MLQELESLIRTFEGFRAKSYLCPAGVWTIGYGSTGRDIGPGLVWTKDQAEERMEVDMMTHVRAARKFCPELSDTGLAAVADFSYNLGAARLAGSTLRRKINARDSAGAAIEFERWVRGGGRILSGLVLRRHVERSLYLKEVG